MVYLPDIRISTTNFYRLLVLTVSPYVLHQLSSLLDQAIFPPWVDLFLAHPISLYHDLNLWRLTKGQATTARAGSFTL